MPTQTHQNQTQSHSAAQPSQAVNAGPAQASAGLTGARLDAAIQYNRTQNYSKARIRGFQSELGVPADGVIGAQTTKAVYAFQASRANLGNDGKIGSSTAAALTNNSNAPIQQNTHAATLTAAAVASAVRYDKGRGYDRPMVRLIQQKVGATPDGSFGPDTVRAVASWQLAQGLVGDGKVGNGTLAKMEIPNPAHENGGNNGQQEQAESGGPVPDGNVTANFAWSEFRSRGDNKAVPEPYRANVRRLCQALEVIRAAFGGREMVLNSGWRSSWWNKQVGGASASQHLYGRAADLKVNGISIARTKQVIEQLIQQGKIPQGGIGTYTTFCHYDIRGSAARWSG